jgi:hypothetical protein
VDRAETYLRLLAERLVRDRGDVSPLLRAALDLVDVGALDEGVATEVLGSTDLALAVRSGQAPFFPHVPPILRHQAADGDKSWDVFPVRRTFTGRTGGIAVSAVVRTADDMVFLAAMRRTGEPVPLEDLAALTATDDTGAIYAFSRSCPVALELSPPLPRTVRWLAVHDDQTERLRLDLTTPVTPSAAEPATDSPAERLLIRQAERLLVATARDQPRGPFLPGETLAVLEGAGLLAPDSEVPTQIAALCEQLRIPAGGLPTPSELPASWRSVLTQASRLHKPPARDPGIVLPLAISLPDLDGLRMLVTGLSGSRLHVIVREPPARRNPWRMTAMSHGPRPSLPATRDMPLSAWAIDDTGHWHVAAVGGPHPHSAGLVSADLTLWPPLGRDTRSVTVTMTGRATSTTTTIEVPR